MDEERKNTAKKLGIFLLIILVAVGYFIWGIFFSQGTLLIIAEAPYTVDVEDGPTVNCTTDPCEIKLKAGYTKMIFDKPDYESRFQSAEIKRGDTQEIYLSFNIIPQITRAQGIPPQVEEAGYKIIRDTENGMQKLIREDDTRERSIAYFQKDLKDPKIIGSDKIVLILDEEIHKVDTKEKTRTRLSNPELLDLKEGKWSADSEYLVFSHNYSDNLWILKGDESTETDLKVSVDQIAWTFDNRLIFVTDQGVSTDSADLAILETKSSGGLNFGIHYPDTNSYTKLAVSDAVTELPSRLIPAANSQVIYFESAGESYQIILKKF